MAVLESNIDRFFGKVEMGRDFFVDAAALLVRMIDEEPQVCERIVGLKRVTWMTMDVLQTFEAIGRGQLAVEAMFLPAHVLNRLIAMPVEAQTAVATAPKIEIVRQGFQGKTDVVLKSPSRLTRREAVVALGPNGVRPVEEQRAIVLEPVVETAPTVVGHFELTVMNGKAFMKRCEKVARAQRVKLDRGTAVVEVVA